MCVYSLWRRYVLHQNVSNLIFFQINVHMCFSLFCKREKKVRVYKDMTYGEFYDKYCDLLFPQCVTKERFLRSNRYRRLFSGDVIRSGDHVVIPKKFVS